MAEKGRQDSKGSEKMKKTLNYVSEVSNNISKYQPFEEDQTKSGEDDEDIFND